MNRKIILIILLIVIAVSTIGYFTFFKKPVPYASQEECEQKTGKQCFLFKGLCQVMEARNRSEEEANEKFLRDCLPKIGTWQPTETTSRATTSAQTTANNEWKVFQDSRYTFQFNYPAKWSVGNQQGTSRVLILKDEKNSEIITVDTGVNLAIIGISYCGAYPQDKRCERLKTDDGGYVVIDWEVSGTANALFSSQDGTYGVSFTLHKINSDTRTIFKEVLSTFKVDDCDRIANFAFRSINQYEVGLGSNGPVMGYWGIQFRKGVAIPDDDKLTFQWHHSDVSESGTYTCKDNVLQVKFFDRSITAHYDGSKGILTWDGVEYKRIE